MSTWFALTVLVAAVGLTYLCCIRPMRRGSCSASGRRTDGREQASRREEIDRLRAEITQARHDLQAGPLAASVTLERGVHAGYGLATPAPDEQPAPATDRRNDT